MSEPELNSISSRSLIRSLAYLASALTGLLRVRGVGGRAAVGDYGDYPSAWAVPAHMGAVQMGPPGPPQPGGGLTERAVQGPDVQPRRQQVVGVQEQVVEQGQRRLQAQAPHGADHHPPPSSS